jgi:hypothetical protein
MLMLTPSLPDLVDEQTSTLRRNLLDKPPFQKAIPFAPKSRCNEYAPSHSRTPFERHCDGNIITCQILAKLALVAIGTYYRLSKINPLNSVRTHSISGTEASGFFGSNQATRLSSPSLAPTVTHTCLYGTLTLTSSL